MMFKKQITPADARAGRAGEPPVNEKARTILSAAQAVFLAHGFSAATADMIQQAAGVSKATVYAHFASKEALFVAAIQQQTAVFMESLRQAQVASGDLRANLKSIGRSYLAQALAPGALALLRVVIAEAERFPQLARTFYLAGPRTASAIVGEQLARGIESGGIDVSDIGLEEAANHFLSLLRGEPQLQCLLHPRSKPSKAQIEHWTEIAVTTFLLAYGTTSIKRRRKRT
jgi:TetR/AcrR family transcriptional regulator, mexJK operon transcriptional repressor